MTIASETPGPGAALPDWLKRGIGVLAALILWEALAWLMQGTFLLAGPIAIVQHISENFGLLWRALTATLGTAALGFVIGNAVAILLAAIAILIPRLEAPIAAIALLVFCLPLVATGPILRVLFGPGIGPQVTLAALAVYYTTFVPLLVGLRAAPAGWFDLVSSYGRGRWAELVYVRAFACAPYLIAGLQIAAPAAFLGAMIGEFTGTERGMGLLAIVAMRSLDVNATWALASLASGVAIIVYLAVGWAGRILWPDRPAINLTAPPDAARRPWWERLAITLGTIVFVILGWQLLLDALGVNAFIGKRPGAIWDYLVASSDAAENRAVLFAALSETLVYTIPGYLAGLILGAVLAALFVLWPALAGAALPVAIALRSIPIVTTAPLIVLALGREAVGTITIVAVMIFFPTVVACIQGLRQAPGQVLDVFDSYAAGKYRRLFYAQVPAMLPALFASARMAVPAAVLAVTVAEWLATGTGIGNLMVLQAALSNYNMLWSAIVVLTLVAFLGYLGVAAVERAVLRVFAPEQVAR
ncbi:MAG: ABC transporter permease subunit [Pseudomonadota bacterium]